MNTEKFDQILEHDDYLLKLQKIDHNLVITIDFIDEGCVIPQFSKLAHIDSIPVVMQAYYKAFDSKLTALELTKERFLDIQNRTRTMWEGIDFIKKEFNIDITREEMKEIIENFMTL